MFFNARAVGIEPTPKVLETSVLPLYYARIYYILLHQTSYYLPPNYSRDSKKAPFLEPFFYLVIFSHWFAAANYFSTAVFDEFYFITATTAVIGLVLSIHIFVCYFINKFQQKLQSELVGASKKGKSLELPRLHGCNRNYYISNELELAF